MVEGRHRQASWEDVAPLGSHTKAYWAQWSSLQLVDGVLYRLWETPEGDNVINQLEFLRPFLHSTITAGHFGLGELPTGHPRLVPQV